MTFPRQTRAVINLMARRGRPTVTPLDIPLIESQALAASLPTQQMPSVLDHGKGLTPQANTDWEDWIAPVLELCRPRGKQCRCGNAGVLRLGDERFCAGCQPRGLVLVDPDGGAA